MRPQAFIRLAVLLTFGLVVTAGTLQLFFSAPGPGGRGADGLMVFSPLFLAMAAKNSPRGGRGAVFIAALGVGLGALMLVVGLRRALG